ASINEAPTVVDCSTMVKWAYGQAGIWLPRHTIDQRDYGTKVIKEELLAGDLVFTRGLKPYWLDNPEDAVGHVGIYSGHDSVVHAANTKRGVVEDSFDQFIGSRQLFRGATRIMPMNSVVLESPPNRIVEWSGEFRTILLQHLG